MKIIILLFGTHSVPQTGLGTDDPPASDSIVLQLQESHVAREIVLFIFYPLIAVTVKFLVHVFTLNLLTHFMFIRFKNLIRC
jgi:hypothetical protein